MRNNKLEKENLVLIKKIQKSLIKLEKETREIKRLSYGLSKNKDKRYKITQKSLKNVAFLNN